MAALSKPIVLITKHLVDRQQSSYVPSLFASITTTYLDDWTSLVKHEVRLNLDFRVDILGVVSEKLAKV